MAKASKKKKKTSFKLPPQLPWAAALLLGLLILMVLLFSKQGQASFLSLSQGPGGGHSLGPAGSYISHWLISSFGYGAFWPVPALLAFAWFSFKGWKINLNFLFKLVGWGLFLFSGLAIMDWIWPSAPQLYSGGGRFGHYLAHSASGILGSFGSTLALPLLALLGLFMAVRPLWRASLALGGRCLSEMGRLPSLLAEWRAMRRENLRSAPPAPPAAPAAPVRKKLKEITEEHELGLEDDPLEFHEPVIVEKPVPEPRPEPPRKKPEPRIEPAPARRESKEPRAYQLPATDFLDLPPKAKGGHASGLSRDQLMENARLLEAKLRDFGVDGRVLEVSGGPVITMYEYQPAPGVKISKVAGLADDLTMAMRAISIRVVAPLPGKPAIGIEIPNPKRSLVAFREVVESPAFQDSASPLSLVLGVDIMGSPVVADLAKMPHLLIAGATGSGKSVGLGSMIMSILYKARPDQVRFLMIDPKCVELALYKDIPHLIYPVLSDPSEATLGLKWAVAEMDSRYKLLAEKGVRNIETYNAKIREELKNWKPPKAQTAEDGSLIEAEPPRELPFLVIIIDELADLMMVSAKEVEVYITRLAQKARAAGIHLILATQRPSVDVLTGIIKANMPTRISFQVSSRIDSRTILDQMGAEKLLGQGDMLFLPPGVGKLRRLHGAFVSDDEIKTVTDFIRDWGPPDYLEDLSLPDAEGGDELDGERDEKYEEAVELVRRTQKATISHVQRHLRIGYNRAARIIEDMEREGIIGPQDGTRPRAIF